MDKLAQLSRRFGLKLSPPSADEFAAAQRAYGFTFHASVRELYVACGGATPQSTECQMRPLLLAELVELQSFTESLAGLAARWRLVFCWTDDQSNYAGVYSDGPLAGMVVMFHHEEGRAEPSYLSLDGFLDAVLAGSVEDTIWKDGFGELPLMLNADLERRFVNADSLAQSLLHASSSERDPDTQRELILCGMQLLPSSGIPRLIEFLRSDDIWIPERAAKILGHANAAEAIDALTETARLGKHNGCISAILALGMIRDARARKALLSLATLETMKRFDTYVQASLRKHDERPVGAGSSWFAKLLRGRLNLFRTHDS